MHDALHVVPARYQTDMHLDHKGATTQDLLNFLSKWWITIAITVAISVAIATVYLTNATPLFTGQAQILVQPKFSQVFREQNSEDVSALDTPEVESKIAILRSERVADRVVKQLGLLKDPTFLQQKKPWRPTQLFGQILSGVESLIFPPVNAVSSEEAQRQGALKQISDNLDAKRLGLAHVIEISYTSPDPKQAAVITNAIAEAYIADQLDMRSESAREGSVWLESRIDRLRDQMNRSELRVKEFKAKRDYRIPGPSDQKEGPATNTAYSDGKTWAGITLEELESQSQTYRKIYESYLQALADSVQRQSYPETNTRIITRANVPNHRSHPRGLLTLAVALIGGSILGLGVALVLQSLKS